ncbi:formate-dependent phosphoribosylglycinamide formyltransferase [Nocardioides sp. zg-536]|uniref:Formate-dependent phosphoribosylglycinamide formyltransferase n=1 Tax=Nocardioides faecalis TaxID=2803858 RepID=A0A939BWP5_9ACTN|nr:formate-dependent phosphoribosylglycinamide formyltransferase [Nocardioides faecalis]MBM9461261.1 formate-dependent phosphoribosylglycinamide formyltransferase [Nocardioides faecalis]
MTIFGTPLSPHATRVLLLGSGELGKELVIELQRLGVETVAVDRYPGAPAMQVAHRSHVIDMLDPAAVRAVIEAERPHWVVPEIEAIHTPTLLELESEGVTVVPTARATRLTMDREGIRRLAAEELGLPTSPYRFADSLAELEDAVATIGTPCVVKPVMSSSGKGQSVVHTPADARTAWEHAQAGGRAGAGRVIVEGFVDFDTEITLLTVKHAATDGGADVISFCAPIGHTQVDGDYRESWQPQALSPAVVARAQEVSAAVVADLCGERGRGLFGVELFVRGEEVIFSELSPRPHDTGLVTLVSQDLSEFALHARAVLGLPIPTITTRGPAASCAAVFEGEVLAPRIAGVVEALAVPDTSVRLFGKPAVSGRRRMAVALALGEDVEQARERARTAAGLLELVP